MVGEKREGRRELRYCRGLSGPRASYKISVYASGILHTGVKLGREENEKKGRKKKHFYLFRSNGCSYVV